MKIYKKFLLSSVFGVGLLFVATSCIGDLDTTPLASTEVTSDKVFTEQLDAYTCALAKIYAGLAIGGNGGGDADQDIAGIDGGSQASFLRGLWNLQELSSDEAHCCWGDTGINDLNTITWTSGNPFIKGLYYRFMYQVQMSNAFLRQTSEDALSSYGVSDANKAIINQYRAEARFHRALAYYYLLDMFRNVPFVDENSAIGSYPKQNPVEETFKYIESELLAIENNLIDPTIGYSSTDYGRATKAAAWALLSRLYLNAEIYIGTPKYTESITYCKKIINAGFLLESKYEDIFKADNHKSKEMIFPIRYEGAETQTWGGMTFLICSTVPSSMKADINAQDAWQGNRAKVSLLKIFTKENDSDKDSRKSMLKTDKTESVEITNPTLYSNGIPVVKFNNKNSDGSLPASNLVWVDFPLFRLGEIYLTYAESVLRGGTGGDKATALGYVNALRKRAYNNDSAAEISDDALTLDFILDERGREFFFEAQRRTDLIRYKKFTGNSYIWTWKGNVQAGVSVNEHYNIFPLPADEVGSNSNLTQNPEY
jgi:SusD family.